MRTCSVPSERGAALVEFAVVLPLLIMLLFGVVDFGRLAFTQINLNDAVQEGSIYASTHPAETDEIVSRVRGNFGSPDDDAYLVTIDCVIIDEDGDIIVIDDDGDVDGDKKLRITVSHSMTTFMPLILPDTFPLDAAVITDIFTSTGTCP